MISDIVIKTFSSLYGDTTNVSEDQTVPIPGNQFYIIPGNLGPKWIIPQNPKIGLPVLKQWHPYELISKIKWESLLFLYAKGLLKKIPGVKSIFINLGETPNKEKNFSSLIPVIYIGTPCIQQKAVATLVDLKSLEPCKIVKIALKASARESLLREAVILKKMKDINLLGIPKILMVETDGKYTIQTVISGSLTSRKLTQSHIDWLLKLPKSDKTTTFNEQRELLNQTFIKKQSFLSQSQRQTVLNIISTLNEERFIPLVMTHGDFAPWNLKYQPHRGITAIDWENSDLQGLPLWDLTHFFFIQAHLFGGQNPFQAMSTNLFVNQYLKRIRMDKNYLPHLILLYLLKTSFSRISLLSDAYSKFLLSQISKVVF